MHASGAGNTALQDSLSIKKPETSMKFLLRVTAISAILAALPLYAKDKPQDPPAITDAHKAAYYKAQVEIDNASPAMQKAQADIQKAAGDAVADCGNDFQPQIDKDGNLICTPKPKPADTPKPASAPK
jgi:hypothetical protein